MHITSNCLLQAIRTPDSSIGRRQTRLVTQRTEIIPSSPLIIVNPLNRIRISHLRECRVSALLERINLEKPNTPVDKWTNRLYPSLISRPTTSSLLSGKNISGYFVVIIIIYRLVQSFRFTTLSFFYWNKKKFIHLIRVENSKIRGER